MAGLPRRVRPFILAGRLLAAAALLVCALAVIELGQAVAAARDNAR